jgi:hypothetical protein
LIEPVYDSLLRKLTVFMAIILQGRGSYDCSRLGTGMDFKKNALAATLITFWLGLALARWMAGREFKGKSFIDGIFNSAPGFASYGSRVRVVIPFWPQRLFGTVVFCIGQAGGFLLVRYGYIFQRGGFSSHVSNCAGSF